ncbi:hypothetical protein VZ95_01370 [Elstera litoralis]|uniref:Uncharacterized protein n=1 Tax=Elstera litoralis TaxID=552518 RepID=A0A0F3IW51_9PROT|nr:hypothetical protein VZ95_01370 [Elstera litoralis]
MRWAVQAERVQQFAPVIEATIEHRQDLPIRAYARLLLVAVFRRKEALTENEDALVEAAHHGLAEPLTFQGL